jgi:GNAT superfamily N-acetyltransferase
MIKVTQAKSHAELKLFEGVAEKVHAQDPYFVPPFPGSVVKLISPKGPFADHGEVVCFIAWKDGKPVGRIAAVENRAHNKYYGDKIGFFGFFDFIDSIEVARALMDAAKSELTRRGLTTLRGPYSPTVNDECGLLVEGFESSPMVMMPYNPPYYVSIYEELGLSPARDLHAYYISAAAEASERILKIVKRVKRTTGITVRPFNLKKLDHDLRIIQTLYNDTLKRNWGFVPITFDDMKASAKDLMAVVDPELVMIAEKNGQPAGFSLVIPNINEFMWKAKSSRGLMRILKFVWLLKTSRPKEARLAILGVKEEFQNKGLGALFYSESLLKGRKKFQGGELSWVEANNEEIIHGITVMGAQKYKNYRIFENTLGTANA